MTLEGITAKEKKVEKVRIGIWTEQSAAATEAAILVPETSQAVSAATAAEPGVPCGIRGPHGFGGSAHLESDPKS